ncbi:Hypothetical protein SCF082_LOCUS8605 [Durusdinium trenchii]|uniref:Uncharacterized protein n=1 Tax=Durusdinium trenchii TaxID=1381693 RepID=A0ABP0ITA8_9DINO
MFSWVDQAKQIFTGTAPARWVMSGDRHRPRALGPPTGGFYRYVRTVSVLKVLCLIITPLVVLIFILIAVFNVCLARLLTAPGAVLFNVLLLWLVLRLVVRVLVFPGSILLWRRNTEASYRAEMAKQFASHLEHLRGFVAEALGRTGDGHRTEATLEGTLLGLMVVEGLARNFRVQQRDQVKFTTEQVQLRGLVQAVEVWLSQAKVLDRRAEIPLNDWLQRHVQNVVKVPLRYAVNSTPLVSEAKAEAEGTLQRLEQLLHIFYDLQRSPDGLCASTRRFLRTPVVGSLNQLRAELLLRYSAQHYWVRTGGRKIDAVFISAKGDRGEALTESPDAKEDAPLKDLEPRGHVVVWCNPNAAYYETMAYESHWLDFYLSQGCSIFVFNYSGFGRSQGHPSPGRLSADGDAVVDFLRRRGFTQVDASDAAESGERRAFGWPCMDGQLEALLLVVPWWQLDSIARKNPDIVKVLVADRTFSTLAKAGGKASVEGEAAKYTFGDWAAKGLSLSATWADNVSNYVNTKCYKVMLCDPKDATIPDLAALRTAVAQKVLEQVPSSERFSYEARPGAKWALQRCREHPGLDRMAEAWTFFEVLLSICDACDGGCVCQPRFGESKRSARQPVVGKPVVETETAPQAGDEDSRLVARPPTPAKVTVQWLQEHSDFVHFTMSPHIDLLRQAVDSLGSRFNASGLPLDEALGGHQEDAAEALQCFLCNLQVWGSLALRGASGEFSPMPRTAVDDDLERAVFTRRCTQLSREELFLARGLSGTTASMSARLAKVAEQLTPSRMSDYHRQLARVGVARVRRDFRQQLSALQRSLDASVAQGDCPLSAAVLTHLREVEKFMTAIYRFFKCVDISGQGEVLGPRCCAWHICTTRPPSAVRSGALANASSSTPERAGDLERPDSGAGAEHCWKTLSASPCF